MKNETWMESHKKIDTLRFRSAHHLLMDMLHKSRDRFPHATSPHRINTGIRMSHVENVPQTGVTTTTVWRVLGAASLKDRFQAP